VTNGAATAARLTVQRDGKTGPSCSSPRYDASTKLMRIGFAYDQIEHHRPCGRRAKGERMGSSPADVLGAGADLHPEGASRSGRRVLRGDAPGLHLTLRLRCGSSRSSPCRWRHQPVSFLPRRRPHGRRCGARTGNSFRVIERASVIGFILIMFLFVTARPTTSAA
jgi:hypothetical protein